MSAHEGRQEVAAQAGSVPAKSQPPGAPPGEPRNAIRLGPRARRLIRAAARVVNPLVLRTARRRHMPIVGVADHSQASQWYQNILAAWGCVITYQGADHAVVGPVVVDRATAGPGYPRYERLALRLIGINEFLWLADAHDRAGRP